jgi:hypothetical protein
MTERRARQRADLLASYDATASEIKELPAYNRNVFDRSVEEATEDGALAALRRRLVQLRFPIREGISSTDA